VVEGADAAMATVRVGGAVLRLPARPGDAPGPVAVVIRPEAIVLGDPAPDGLAGRIATATYMGSHAEYTVETAAGTLFAVAMDTGQMRPPGAAVALTFRERGVMLVPDGAAD
jgi:iron(III) transport system ATP-binding protein